MSPEVLFSKNHSFSVDFYALGIISYELMLGDRQYQSITRIELREEILKKQALIKNINLKKRKFNLDINIFPEDEFSKFLFTKINVIVDDCGTKRADLLNPEMKFIGINSIFIGKLFAIILF